MQIEEDPEWRAIPFEPNNLQFAILNFQFGIRPLSPDFLLLSTVERSHPIAARRLGQIHSTVGHLY